jgi:hypothetical protein
LITSITDVEPLHVPSYIEWIGRRADDPFQPPRIKQQLAATRQLFD